MISKDEKNLDKIDEKNPSGGNICFLSINQFVEFLDLLSVKGVNERELKLNGFGWGYWVKVNYHKTDKNK